MVIPNINALICARVPTHDAVATVVVMAVVLVVLVVLVVVVSHPSKCPGVSYGTDVLLSTSESYLG